MSSPFIKLGTILVHSIGCGCHSFYQVVDISELGRTITVHQVEYKVTKRSIKYQAMEIAPQKNKFVDSQIQDSKLQLRISDKGKIGPSKRLQWWRIWDGQPCKEYSN